MSRAAHKDEHQQLLRDLKETVEGLLVSQVSNVWCIYGGLNRLHNNVEKIFVHGCKAFKEDGTTDVWQFIQGLEWLQPDTSKSTFNFDSDYKTDNSKNTTSDIASLWLLNCIKCHYLSQKMLWLLSDKSHILSCYAAHAFLNQEKYTEAMIICLRAVERNQPSLLSEIDPLLFLSKNNEHIRVHRRCSSFPDAHYRSTNINNYNASKSRTMQDITNSKLQCKRVENNKMRKDVIHGKLKAWSSMPNLGHPDLKLWNKLTAINHSHTTPSTPVHSRYSSWKENKDSIVVIDLKLMQPPVKENQKPYVFDNNIVEHTPPLHRLEESLRLSSETKGAKSASKTLKKNSPDFSFMDAISGVAGLKDCKKQPKKRFIEDGGMSVLPMSTGYFPRPTKGQSLTEFLQSSQFSRTNAELDRENAHFSISEAMIGAMEQLRCRRDLKLVEEQVEESDEEIMNLKQRIRTRRRQKLEEKQRNMWGVIEIKDANAPLTSYQVNSPYLTSADDSDTLSSEEIDMEIDEAASLVDKRGLSMSMASLYSEADLLRRSRGAPDGASDILSAEGVALSLISKFKEKHLPRASDLEWLVSEKEAPQALLPLPKSWPVSPDDAEEIPVTPLRGTKEWAPPRPQIIFTLHKAPKKMQMLQQQNYRCAGCGFKVEKKYSSAFRFCNYLGRYFCTQCHTNQVAMIPARILQKWNFTKYTVSTFSYRLLEQMYADPLFPVFDLNKSIEKLSKNLVICRNYRHGLVSMKEYIQNCRYAENVQSSLQAESWLYNDMEVYSIQDLFNIQNGELKTKLKYLVELCSRHINECELCLARGFMCEICKSDQIIFPWQNKLVVRCQVCGTCYHKECWNPHSSCLRCERINKKKASL